MGSEEKKRLLTLPLTFTKSKSFTTLGQFVPVKSKVKRTVLQTTSILR